MIIMSLFASPFAYIPRKNISVSKILDFWVDDRRCIKITETENVEVLQKWIEDHVVKKKLPKFLAFSVNPRPIKDGVMVSSVHLLDGSSSIIYRGLEDKTSLPKILKDLFDTVTIDFLGFNMVKKKTKSKFLGQFQHQLHHNMRFLTVGDKKVDWNLESITRLTNLLKENERNFCRNGKRCSNQWTSKDLPLQNIQYSTVELLLSHEAGKIIMG